MISNARALWLTLGWVAIACGGKVDDDASAASDAGAAAKAQFYIQATVPARGSTTGASYKLHVDLSPSNCATTTVGGCTVNPCYVIPADRVASAGADSDVGTVDFSGTTLTPSSLVPGALGSDGPYAEQTVSAKLPWTAGGESVTLQWAHPPGDLGADSSGVGQLTATTPPYVSLTRASAFAATTTTLDRSKDLMVSWTTDNAAGAGDQLAVYFLTGTTQLGCNFAASDGAAVVPAVALQSLAVGAGTFDIHSKGTSSTSVKASDGAPWTFTLVLDAAARTSYGVASGPVTFQ